ncbi:MAG: hypothetical protein A2X86_09225 [Bdellovibrionales bacterium GWA2_49_15]|nr:MAG: hypothetical protein A2X86_09225 [Bdellovibrionales bacterium GWA2_49_15]
MTSMIELRITLEDTEPAVWRKILVPQTISLENLHYVVQMAMGWENDHLYSFTINKKEYGEGDEDGFGELPRSLKTRLGKCLLGVDEFSYLYDFGDNWEHRIEVIGFADHPQGLSTPLCTDGENACPPEDCGGAGGFHEIKRALKQKRSKKNAELLEWVRDYDPKVFQVEKVNRAIQLNS